MNLYMTGTSGVFKTVYSNTAITVKIFEAPELELGNGSQAVFQAIITYVSEDGTTRQDLNTLSNEEKKHCQDHAVELAATYKQEAWGQLHKAYMGEVYWSLIK